MELYVCCSCRKCAERSPIAPMEKSTLGKITRHLPVRLRENYASCVNQLLEEASREYETSLRTGSCSLPMGATVRCHRKKKKM
jgi:hypothetical protein